MQAREYPRRDPGRSNDIGFAALPQSDVYLKTSYKDGQFPELPWGTLDA
jgi:hypothetical protein